MGFAPPALEINPDCKHMNRREFLKSTAPAAVGVAAACYIRPARAQQRKEMLLTAPESGPNNLDIVGVGTTWLG
jgi:peptide/nickel transport system substrate-binding protein